MFHRLLSLLLPCLLLSAMEIGDPWASLDRRHLVACLASLREPLDRAPDDQRLLGLAIVSYVNLSLGYTSSTHGMSGPWQDYARVLVARRQEARKGRPLERAADAIPEWWFSLIVDGESAAVLAAMDKTPSTPTDAPLLNSLRMLATRNWELPERAGRQTLIECYARAVAAMECGDRTLMERYAKRLPRTMQEHAGAWWEYQDHAWLVRELLADVVWMLQSPTIASQAGNELAQTLARSCGASADGTDRNAILKMIRPEAACPDGKDGSIACARVAIGAMGVCFRLRDQPAGVMDGKRHRLVGLGDIARDLGERLAQAVMDRRYGEEDWKPMQGIAAGFTGDPVISARLKVYAANRYTDGMENPEGMKRVSDADRDGLVRALGEALRQGTPSTLTLRCIRDFSTIEMMRLPPLVRLAVERLEAAGVPPRGARLRCIAHASLDSLSLPMVRTWIEEAMRADPHSLRLRQLWQRFQPDRPRLVLTELADGTVVPTVSATTPFLKMHNNFATRWKGAIRIDAPGRHRFTLRSWDGSRLTIGGAVLDCWTRRDNAQRSMELDLQPGWHPIEVQWFQVGPYQGFCRMSWCPPGGTRDVPVPAEVLSHGEDRTPGLLCDARKMEGLARPPLPLADDRQWVADRPWQFQASVELGSAMTQHGQYEDALGVFLKVAAGSQQGKMTSWTQSELIACALLKPTPDIPLAVEWLGRGGNLNLSHIDHFGDALSEHVLAIGAERQVVDALMALRRQGDNEGGKARTRQPLSVLAFPAGEFAVVLEPDLIKNRYYYWYWRERQCMLECIAAIRILGRSEEDVPRLAQRARQRSMATEDPVQLVALSYYLGEITWLEAERSIATAKNGAELHYFRALQCIAEHRWDEAARRLDSTIAAMPTSSIGLSAAGLKRWLDRLTPEQRAKRPKGTALGPEEEKVNF